MAAPVFAWASGCDLMQLAGFGVPEGDLIRILRMTIQLLRTLRDRIDDPVCMPTASSPKRLRKSRYFWLERALMGAV
ncbi:hypothetical protein R80B4_02663 [Fibrobacteres bacterium R8-0-B4]